MSQHHDPFGAKPTRRQRPAEAHGSISDHNRRITGMHSPRDCRMMSRCHHVGYGENSLEKGFVPFDRRRHDDQRRISETGANRFGLTSFVSKAPESSLHACAIKTLLAELARAISKVVRGDDAVSSFDRSDGWPNIFNNAHPFMPYLPTWRIGTLSPIRPEISAANTRVRDTYDGVSGLKDAGIGYLLNPNIECSTKHGCTHIVFSFGAETPR
jgi:hypothetical protein